jgi:hypothetical protein
VLDCGLVVGGFVRDLSGLLEVNVELNPSTVYDDDTNCNGSDPTNIGPPSEKKLNC